MGSAVFTAIAIFGMGLMLGLDALVSRAHGARQPAEALRWLHQGIWVAFALGPAAMAVTWGVMVSVNWWGLHPDVRVLVGPCLGIIALSALPLLLYASFRRYLQGLHIVRPIMFALLSANVVNAIANWLLVYGNFGMPEPGVEGSAWATTIARVYMAGFLYMTIRRVHTQRGSAHPRVAFAPDLDRARRLVRLGAPAASQVTLEVAVFAAATALAGRLDPTSSAANQIALNIASLAFMVPLGLASASAVRVGHAVGAREPTGPSAPGGQLSAWALPRWRPSL